MSAGKLNGDPQITQINADSKKKNNLRIRRWEREKVEKNTMKDTDKRELERERLWNQ